MYRSGTTYTPASWQLNRLEIFKRAQMLEQAAET